MRKPKTVTLAIEVPRDIFEAFWQIVNAGRGDAADQPQARVGQALEQLMRRYINEHLKSVEDQHRKAAAGPQRDSLADAIATFIKKTPGAIEMLREEEGLNRWPLNAEAKPQTIHQAVKEAKARGHKLGLQDAEDEKDFAPYRERHTQKMDGAA